ncbi:DUF1127 domain-containing protein [Loktanella salsilacus]|uniref:DUF1127 domain-containing protein n=1 Tax=Loktanella salsilacus TaxID=195913 RepID=UPI003703F544
MALANTNTISTTSGLRGTIESFRSKLSDHFQRRQVYAQTKRELTSLTVRELNDIGIRPGDIERISREAAAML